MKDLLYHELDYAIFISNVYLENRVKKITFYKR